VVHKLAGGKNSVLIERDDAVDVLFRARGEPVSDGGDDGFGVVGGGVDDPVRDVGVDPLGDLLVKDNKAGAKSVRLSK